MVHLPLNRKREHSQSISNHHRKWKRKWKCKIIKMEFFIFHPRLGCDTKCIHSFIQFGTMHNEHWTHSMSPNKQTKSLRITWKSLFCFILQKYWNDPDMQSDWKLWKKKKNNNDCDVIWYIKCNSAFETLSFRWAWCGTENDGKWMYESLWRHSKNDCARRVFLFVCMREYSEYTNSKTNNQEN